MARVCSLRRAARFGLRCFKLYGKGVRLKGGDGFYGHGPVDGFRIGIRAAARLLAHPICCGSGWLFLQILWPPSSEEELSLRLADRHWNHLDSVQLLFARNSH